VIAWQRLSLLSPESLARAGEADFAKNVECEIGYENSVPDLSRARYYFLVAYCKLSVSIFNLEREER
jgi:hypothetical protein